MTKPFTFSLFNRVADTAILHNSTQNFRITNFSCQTDLFQPSPQPRFK